MNGSRRPMQSDSELSPSLLPRAIGRHAVRWGCLLLLAALTYVLFPVAGTVDVPNLQPGDVATAEVIAPFDFIVSKTNEEMEREAQALAASVPPIYDFTPSIVDTVLAASDSLFSALTAAPNADSLSAIAAIVGMRFTEEEATYLSTAGRLAAFRQATRNFLRRSLRKGVTPPGAAEPTMGRQIIVRRNGSEQLALRDTLHTYETFLDARFIVHPDPNSSLGDQVFRKFINHLFRASLELNEVDTEAKRQEMRASVGSVKDSVRANVRIVDANDPVTREAAERLSALRAELLRRGGGGGWTVSGIVGQVLANGLILAVFWLLVMLYRTDIYDTLRHMLVITLLFALAIIGAWVSRTQLGDWPELIPIPFAVMLMTVLFRGRVAMVGAMVLAVLIASQAVYGGGDAVFVALVGGVAAAVSVRGIRHRNRFLSSVALVIAAYVLADVTAGLRSGWSWGEIGTASLWGGANAVISGAIAFILLPVFESVARVTTDLTLLELSDPSRPLLRRLATEAPGTYAHSMAMANLCESACNAIGANGLLARVGCYYHDVGKLKKPQSFVENQVPGINPHDKLKPEASAAIIRNHVRDGLALAEEHKLPEVIKSFIPEHHGTMEITYFLERARERDPEATIDADEFRYPGPRPRSVETSVVMLGDGIEAALRVIDEPTPETLKDAIDHIIQHRIEVGQLADAPITLAQITRIREEFVRVLAGQRHGRVDYPAAGGGIAADFQAASQV